jgi:hypothetical protein
MAKNAHVATTPAKTASQPAVAAKAARKVKAGTILSNTPKLADAPAAPELPPEIKEEQRKADRRANDIAKTDAMSQFVNQQTGAKPAVDMDAFNAELAELMKKHKVDANVKIKAAKGNKIVQNGVTRPADNTTCGKIWAAADEISVKQHGVAAIASVREHPALAGVNDHTIKTQYAKWRAFNNISGRLPRIQAVHQTVGHYEGIPEVAPKSEPAAE